MRDEITQLEEANQAVDFTEALRRVSGEVLETMFFTEAMPADCEHSWLGGAVSVQVGFDGSHVGEMWLAVGEEAVPALASAFLGLDPEEASAMERSQVILELANILCGAVLSSLWRDSRLQLDAPKLAAWDCGGEGVWHCCLTLPEGRLAISIRLVEMKPAP